MKLAIGADHRGLEAASRLADRLRTAGHDVSLIAPEPGEHCDYPEPAHAVALGVAEAHAERGICVCGTGVGTAIAANKVAGIRAATVHDELTSEICRSHNDANVLCLSADLLGQRLIEKIVDVFLATRFEGGRHERRVRKITAIERGDSPAGVD